MECRFNDTDFGALQNTARHGRILNLSSSDTRPHRAKRIGEFQPGSKVTCAVFARARHSGNDRRISSYSFLAVPLNARDTVKLAR